MEFFETTQIEPGQTYRITFARGNGTSYLIGTLRGIGFAEGRWEITIETGIATSAVSWLDEVVGIELGEE